MPTFRKLPVLVEAVRFFGAAKVPIEDAPVWLLNAALCGAVRREGTQLVIKTLEGEMLANDGDWIIRGVQGELYPCKPDIFAATYEQVVASVE